VSKSDEYCTSINVVYNRSIETSQPDSTVRGAGGFAMRWAKRYPPDEAEPVAAARLDCCLEIPVRQHGYSTGISVLPD
jgi:hypothetical protein